MKKSICRYEHILQYHTCQMMIFCTVFLRNRLHSLLFSIRFLTPEEVQCFGLFSQAIQHPQAKNNKISVVCVKYLHFISNYSSATDVRGIPIHQTSGFQSGYMAFRSKRASDFLNLLVCHLPAYVKHFTLFKISRFSIISYIRNVFLRGIPIHQP